MRPTIVLVLVGLLTGCIQQAGQSRDWADTYPRDCGGGGCHDVSGATAPPPPAAEVDRGADVRTVALSVRAENSDTQPDNEVVVQILGTSRSSVALRFAGGYSIDIDGPHGSRTISGEFDLDSFSGSSYAPIFEFALPASQFADGQTYSFEGEVTIAATGVGWPVDSALSYSRS